MENKLHDFPANLKRIRLSHGMTQRILARHLGVTEVCVARWERGEREPQDFNLFMRLCLALHCRAEHLIYPAT